MSTPRNITFYIGDEKKFELNDDGFYDLYVKLNNIVSGKANVSIKEIHEEIPGGKTNTDQASENQASENER